MKEIKQGDVVRIIMDVSVRNNYFVPHYCTGRIGIFLKKDIKKMDKKSYSVGVILVGNKKEDFLREEYEKV